jgi:hypothetical protein
MTPSISTALLAAGWTPGRRIDISPLVAEMQSWGFKVIPEAGSILEEFGRLKIEPLHSDQDAYYAEVIFFDPLQTAELDRLLDCERRLATQLSPIGALRSDATLMVASGGGIFVEWGGILKKAGNSLWDAFENTLVCAQRQMEVIEEIADN